MTTATGSTGSGKNSTLSGGALSDEGPATYLSQPDGTFERSDRSLGVERRVQGRYIGPGGGHVIFTTGTSPWQDLHCYQQQLSPCPVNRLEPKAPEAGTGAIYDREANGSTHVVSLLPEDNTPEPGEQAFYQGASQDGATVAFKIDVDALGDAPPLEGTLFVRVSDQEDGETLKVAEGPTTFAGLSRDGHYLFYVGGDEKGTIHRFDTTNEADVAINPGAPGEVVNVSADGSHVYFISEEEVGGAGEAGKPNLYVWSSGSIRYVVTVSPSDLVRTSGQQGMPPALTNWTDYAVTPAGPGAHVTVGPGADSSRTTPDGSVLIFESKAQLTPPYDNAGRTEIYRWDDEAETLTCVSCNPSGTAASGDARLQELRLLYPSTLVQNLTADGNRVFFETNEALAPQDTDGVNDIYEWRGGRPGQSAADLVWPVSPVSPTARTTGRIHPGTERPLCGLRRRRGCGVRQPGSVAKGCRGRRDPGPI